MTRFEKLQQQWRSLFRISALKPSWIGIDMGSHTTKVVCQDQPSMLFPTCLVREKQSRNVIAVGTVARKMIGKLPESMEIIYPIRGGKIVDIAGCSALLEYLLNENLPQSLLHLLTPPRLYITHPFLHLEAQRLAWVEIVRKKTPRAKVITLADALWKAVTTDRVFTHQGCVIDIGAMTTKYYLYIDDRLAASFMTDVGGENWTRMMREKLRQKYQLEVGWGTAEYLKKKAFHLGTAPQRHAVQGKNLLSNMPETQVIQDDIFVEGAAELINSIAESFQQFAQQGSPEMVSKLIEKGIYLTGGGSQVGGLRSELEKKLKLPISLSLTPQIDSIKGVKLWV